jgi:hypothetical protein
MALAEAVFSVVRSFSKHLRRDTLQASVLNANQEKE